jgi:hypothetical protein
MKKKCKEEVIGMTEGGGGRKNEGRKYVTKGGKNKRNK